MYGNCACFTGKVVYLLVAIIFIVAGKAYAQIVVKRYQHQRKTVYFINPQTGSDRNSGATSHSPWKTFAPCAKLTFVAGDELKITAAGAFHETLIIHGEGNRKHPVTVSFAPGRYDFFPDKAQKKQLNISNTNDDPQGFKAIAICIDHAAYVNIKANGARVVLRGKMIETYIDHSHNINITGISYDYARPTVSELTVIKTEPGFADLKINAGSKYQVNNGKLNWVGEGWSYQAGWYWQELNMLTNEVARKSLSLDSVKFEDKGNCLVRATFNTNPGFIASRVYQTRDVTRDCAGIFMERCSNIIFKNVKIYYMHGMGMVAQFCNNISIDSLSVRPNPRSGRTCAAWADILHFSGCKGNIKIKNCYLSAANDDAVNVHGTYLRIVEQPAANQLKVRFMHSQTYGFEAFTIGDSIQLVNAETLMPYQSNLVTKVVVQNEKDVLLTLQTPLAGILGKNDVVENITWTPSVHISNCTIARIPTRGVLISTRKKVVIEHNRFQLTHASAIMIADDAKSWFESGRVQNVTIRKNLFLNCGGPIIQIHPENTQSDGYVHQHIKIAQNHFFMNNTQLLDAKSTEGILLSGNMIKTSFKTDVDAMINLSDCRNITVHSNCLIKK